MKKENDFYVVQELFLFGQDWRTRVEFDKRDAGRVEEAKAPVDLFLSKDDETPAAPAPAADADKAADKDKAKEDKKLTSVRSGSSGADCGAANPVRLSPSLRSPFSRSWRRSSGSC